MGTGEAMSTVKDAEKYRQLGIVAASLKLDALKRRAMDPQTDDERWPMLLASHNAAKHELWRLDLVSDPSPRTEARARLEAAGLFLEAGNPADAERQRQALMTIEDALDGPERAFLAKIEREHKPFVRAYTPVLLNLRREETRTKVGSRDMWKLLAKYPGVADLWQMLHLVAVRERNQREARVAITRARDLNPDDPFSASMTIMLPTMFLPIRQLATVIDENRASEHGQDHDERSARLATRDRARDRRAGAAGG